MLMPHTNRNPPALRPFKKGNGGRPKLLQAFLEDLAGAWEKHGVSAIERMAQDQPAKFVQTVASVMPKQLEVTPVENMSDEQLQAELDRALEHLAASAGWQRIPQEPGSEADDGTLHKGPGRPSGQ